MYNSLIINNSYLHNKCSHHDNNKHRITEDARKHISLSVYFTRVDFIEELQHDKCIEHDTRVNCRLTARCLQVTIFNVKQVISHEDKDEEDDQLIDGMTKDIPYHGTWDEWLGAAIRFPL